MSLANTGGSVTYVSNPEYSIAIVNSSIWEQEKTAGSPYFGIGFNKYDISGNLEPATASTRNPKRLKMLNVDALTARIGYGKNWIWQNWYAGGGISYDGFLNKVSYSFNGNEKDLIDLQANASAGFAGGYRWTRTKLGIFARMYSWKVKIEDHNLSTTTGLVGLYLSSFF